MMLKQIQEKLKTAVNFPSPPAVAQQIIALAGDPDVDLAKLVATISKDPGLAAKILRVANSPIYSKRRKSENLRQALVVLGLNAATTLALSFSLVGTYKKIKSVGIDYTSYWRRAILGASAARAFASAQRINNLEDVFLAALLQDIAVLAIDRVQSDFYNTLKDGASHADLAAYEALKLGTDHAGVGAWLLEHWKLPEFLCRAVQHSHAPAGVPIEHPVGAVARCVAIGGECVDILMSGKTLTDLGSLSAHAQEWLGIGPEALSECMTAIVAEIPEIARLFDTTLLDADTANGILEQARELLMIRNLQAIEQVNALQESSEHLEARTVELEDKQRRDALTGLYNRGYLDRFLLQEFSSASRENNFLSVVFADLDRFKLVNDTYGHPSGDSVLIGTARLILSVVRGSDCVARYGGEEFVIVLPGLNGDAAAAICERLIEKLRTTLHEVSGASITTTASLGLATHGGDTRYGSVAELIEAADRSVYAAKRAGRNRLVRFSPQIIAKSA
jgi:diguanylate cyclase (GGDEF)-like protein